MVLRDCSCLSVIYMVAIILVGVFLVMENVTAQRVAVRSIVWLGLCGSRPFPSAEQKTNQRKLIVISREKRRPSNSGCQRANLAADHSSQRPSKWQSRLTRIQSPQPSPTDRGEFGLKSKRAWV